MDTLNVTGLPKEKVRFLEQLSGYGVHEDQPR